MVRHAGWTGLTHSLPGVVGKPQIDEARSLVGELDREIANLYPGYDIGGPEADEIEKAGGYFVVAREQGSILGCGGFLPIGAGCAEIKRMFVRPGARRRGVARQILRHLEAEVRRRGFQSIVLETGCENRAAIAMYESEGYGRIAGFAGHVGIAISRCYSKRTA
jgi:GNAT superfamily N-acetyltransferase